MTDTVNVPREPTEAMIDVAIGHIGGGSTFNEEDRREIAGDIYRAMLAAAPKAEPVSDPYKLAEVEKRLVAVFDVPEVTLERVKEASADIAEIFAHPAPASDGIELRGYEYRSGRAEEHWKFSRDKPIDHFGILEIVPLYRLAQHKGPQS